MVPVVVAPSLPRCEFHETWKMVWLSKNRPSLTYGKLIAAMLECVSKSDWMISSRLVY